MNKLYLLLGLLFLSLSLSAQERWAFGLQIAGGVNGQPDFADHSYHDVTFGSTYNTYRKHRTPNMALGWWMEYHLGRRMSLRTGGEYQFSSQLTSNENVRYLPSGARNNQYKSKQIVSERWVNIPLTVQYYFADAGKNWRPFLQVGARAGFLHRQLSRTEELQLDPAGERTAYLYENELNIDEDWYPLKRWNVSTQLGLGVQLGRAELSLVYLGNFQHNNTVDVYRLSNPFIDDLYTEPYWHHNGRHRMPASLRLNFQYRL
ncbi:MAG: outer membrane beta-barrel protein [Bacteroidota bacterium]